MLLGILLSFQVLEGCATPVPDIAVCVQTTSISGHCFMSISNTEWDIDPINLYQGMNWTQFQATSLYLPSDSYAAIKNYLLLTCEQNNNCPAVVTSQVKKKLAKISKGLNEQSSSKSYKAQ